MLVSRASRISASIDEIAYTQQQIGLITGKIDSILASLGSSSNGGGQLSNIVSLLNLPRAISEYTQQNIGQIIQIPYNDQSGIITSLIDFQVVGVNHHKDINDETKQTITLMSKYGLRYVGFDAIEPSNPINSFKESGNCIWAVSNIRQWLNSQGEANSWFTPQHEYDAEPNQNNIDCEFENGAYSDEAGFLAGFSSDIKSHFATVRSKTWNYLTSSYDETNDKIFLPSLLQIGITRRDQIAWPVISNIPEEGTTLTKFNNMENIGKTSINGNDIVYWLRSCDTSQSLYAMGGFDLDGTGLKYSWPTPPYAGDVCIAPIIVLKD